MYSINSILLVLGIISLATDVVLVSNFARNAEVKDAGKTDRKSVQQKQAVAEKDKKLSIHERIEINKRIIQEKQGKDKPERGANQDVRTV